MELLGDRNWWFPRWLDRLVPHVHVEAGSDIDAELARLARLAAQEEAELQRS
jgi:RND superfamily putative drug exporter